jgi:thiamine pyrophosphate-dependent acetolactate synthase large subunit-like protein
VVIINNRTDRGGEEEATSKLTELRFKVGQETGDYSALASALGFHAERVEDPEALRPTLRKAIDHVRSGGRALIEVITKRVPVTLHSASGRSAGHAA